MKGTEKVSPLLAMSQPELTRLEILQRVKRKTLRQHQAAEPLEHSVYREHEQHQAKVVPSKLLQPAAARAAARPKQKRSPVPLSHPWRRFDFTENSMQARERRGELCILRK